jgi:hypothetical protein
MRGHVRRAAGLAWCGPRRSDPGGRARSAHIAGRDEGRDAQQKGPSACSASRLRWFEISDHLENRTTDEGGGGREGERG